MSKKLNSFIGGVTRCRLYHIMPGVAIGFFLLLISINQGRAAAYNETSSRKLNAETIKKEVRGTVRDSIDILIGVTVMVKGTKTGVTTDVNGKFILDVPDEDAVLVFSMVGYTTQEIAVRGKEVINVTLKTSANKLDDVVIVAFGSQKKTDLVGSVTTISTKDLKVPSSNLTTALAGRAAGIIAYQRSGEPGQDNADFFVRGVTTFGYKTSPLILIDGMELTTTDLARLQPDDISSFTIMKDATSTAVYGARGANGVILVTTKQGVVGKAKLSFRMENSISAPTSEVSLADPITYMKLSNESVLTRNPIGAIPYSEEKIENTQAGKNPIVYPANNWKEMLFKDYTMNQRANLSISGGGGVARYFVSGSFNKDNGILKVDKRNNFNNNIDLKSYTLRSNVTIDVTKATQMIVRLSGNFDDYTGPIDGGGEMYRKVMRSNPVLFPATYPVDEQHRFVRHIMYGNFASGNYINPYADMTKGYKDYSRSLMLAQLELKQDLASVVKGLYWRTMMNTNRNSFFDVSRFYNPYLYTLSGYDQLNNTYKVNNINETSATEYLGYQEGPKTVESTFYLESMLNYNNQFKKHGLSGLLVYMMRKNLAANAGDLQLSLPFKNVGLSGRATYSYDNRYFAEFTFGYNGSERFAESKRFGFFPSGGLAWTISNEKFFEKLKPVVNNLRLRATYGLIGNDAIGSASDRFFYLSNVNMNDGGKSASFGNGIGSPLYTVNGVTISRYSNPDITWETATKRNLALELGLFNKLTIQADYYDEVRKNILMTRSAIPVTMGLSAPVRANVGQATGSGTDISVDYQQTLNKSLWFSARGNFTYAKSKFKVFEEPQYSESYRSRIGYSLHQSYGYIAERLFIDDAEAANSPKQNFGPYGGGDIKYLDVNRDGQITEADQVPIGNPTLPEITYGFGFSMGVKNFDFSAFFQGLANESFWIDPVATSPFAGETQLLEAYANSYWSEDKRDLYALWPRLSSTVNANNTQRSTWFMRDGSFLRLKQVEFGYSLPKKVQSRIRASNFRIYVNATNLLNFSRFKLWDVEMGGNGLGYPVQRVFNMGLNMSFN
ncbi:MAG: TonB-dependent receptor [Sphingobacteriaceae bacterium]|nr:TonB-dependent receptor [Sphingobacteriaceae bacterium]